MNVIYVYGTLRPGVHEPVEINGTMYDLGWFPGVRLGGASVFLAERIEVSDDKLRRLDYYEGYDEKNEASSFYLRRPCLDGFIYEYNGDLKTGRVIPGGDWLSHMQQQRGTATWAA